MATMLRSAFSLRTAVQTAARARFAPASNRLLSTYPSDRKYNQSHEWVKVDGDIATVGITHHAQAELGDIVFAELPQVGSEANAGKQAATVESVKASAEIYAPISGEVVGVNNELESNPELINSDPHENGWMFQVKLSDPSSLDAMLESDAYEKSLEEK